MGMKCRPRRSGMGKIAKYIDINQQNQGDKPRVGMELLFVGSRGSDHVVLEWLCSPREDTAPGNVLWILSHGSSCRQLSTSFSSSVILLVHSFSLSFFMGFKDLPGRPFWFAPFLVLERIFQRKFGIDWWTLQGDHFWDLVLISNLMEGGENLNFLGN